MAGVSPRFSPIRPSLLSDRCRQSAEDISCKRQGALLLFTETAMNDESPRPKDRAPSRRCNALIFPAHAVKDVLIHPDCSLNDPLLSRTPLRPRSALAPPSIPSRIICRGPLGQSKLTAGTPQAMASQSAIGKPSVWDVMANKSAPSSTEYGSSAHPLNFTRSATPKALASSLKASSSEPTPQSSRDQSLWLSAILVYAFSSLSSPFNCIQAPR